MLGWLFPASCPCQPLEKAWVEERLQWLEDEFDDHAFNGRPIVLPTPEFFPDPYDSTEHAAERMFARICGMMDVDRDCIDLIFHQANHNIQLETASGAALPSAAGTYQSDGGMFTITIEKSQFHSPEDLVGTMAHELAHVRLLGEYRLDGDAYDNELLTDLTVVFFGLGIFLANSPRVYESGHTTWPDTEISKPEYLSSPMYGYALAHLAWFRGETRPIWASHLGGGSRGEFFQALKFLNKTGQSEFRPKKLRGRR